MIARFAASVLVLASCATAGAQEFASSDPATDLATSDDFGAVARAARVSIGRGAAALPAVRHALAVGRARNRGAAISVLEPMRDKEAVAVLLDVLARGDAEERALAAGALAWQRDVPFESALAAAATHRTWSVRRAAARALAACGDPAAVDALERLTRDEDADVRAAAFDSLLCSESVEFVPEALVRAFPNLDHRGRESALDLLYRADVPLDASFCSVAAERSPPPIRLRAIALRARLLGAAAVLASPDAELVVRASADGRSDLRDPAQFVLARDRAASAPLVRNALAAADDDIEAAALADALVELVGPAARAPLLDVAEHGGAAARAGAVRALRRFRAPATGADLAWLYSTDAPRLVRDALLSAFEEFASTAGGRSGLLAALEDKDTQLRYRAFAALVRAGVRDAELPLLTDRIRREGDRDNARKMVRLLVTKASGDTARRLVYPLARLLTVRDPARGDARDALESLKDPELREEVARLVLDRLHAPWSLADLRLLTRLSGAEADAVVAAELSRAAERHATEWAKELLIQLRTGGGPAAVAAARPLARGADGTLRDEALHTLLSRSDALAAEILAERWSDLSIARRAESVALVGAKDAAEAARLAPFFRGWLARENDPIVRVALVERIGEIGCPVSDLVAPLVAPSQPVELRAAAIDALAALDDEPARAAVRGAFDAAIDGLRAAKDRELDESARLLLLTAARAVAAHGDPVHAERLSALLFAHVPRLESRWFDDEAGFDFEESIAEALILLARTADSARTVSAALEVELDRRKGGGDLYLLPKALLLRLGRRFELANSAFRPAAIELYEAALLLPPHGVERESLAAVRVAEAAAAEHDMAGAAEHLRIALIVIDRASAQDLRLLREDLGVAEPFVGYDPIARLRAELHLARAADRLEHGKDGDARREVEAALRFAPFDAGFRSRAAAFVLSGEIDPALAAEHAERAAQLAPFDGETLESSARILRATGRVADAERLEKDRAALAACGLEPRR